jgi:uncharacterized membrane protein
LDIAGVLAGPALIGMVGRVVATSIAGMFTEGLLNFAKGEGVKKAIGAVKDRFLGQVNTAVQATAQLPSVPSQAGTGQAATGVINGAEEAAQAASGSKVNWGQALVKMAAITLFIVVGMVGILYAIFRFAKAIQENKITPASIATASLAMITTATAMVAVAGAVKLLSTINLNPGMLAKITGGLLIVGLVGAGMAFAAKKMIDVFGGIPLPKINKTVLVMAAVGTFFLAAAGVAAIATVIGGAAIVSGGMGALAIAAGLAILALTIEGMAVQGIRIMTAVDRFRPGPGFAEKAQVFVELMKGIGSFVGSVAQLIAATRPGILDFLRGAGSDEQRRTLASVNTTISALTTQIIHIVETLKGAISGLQGSEAQLHAAQALGSILGAVAELGNALKPPAEALQESGWYTTLTGGGEDISAKINATTQFMQAIAPQLRTFVRLIGDMFKGGGVFAQGITADQERAAQVVPNILKGVADFANALRAGSSAILQLASKGNQAGILNAVSNYMSSLLKGISESSLFAKIGNLITSISTSVSSLNPAQAKAVEMIAPIIGPIFTTISQIAGIVSSLSAGNMTPQAANVERIAQLTDFVSTFFSRIQTTFPRLIRDMNTVFSGMSSADVTKFSAGTKAINGLLGSVTQFLTSATLNPIEIQSKFASLSVSLAAMQIGMGRIADQLENSTSLQSTITRVVDNIQRVHFERVSTVVAEMVSKTNELSTQIKGLEPINIETGLRRLGDSLGLGAEGNYTIQHRNFNINVNLTVKIDNNGLDALELAMLRRVGPNNTRIQHGDLTR